MWFEKSSYTATEGGSTATVTVALSKAWQTGQTLTLPLRAPDFEGGARENDVSRIPSSVTFAPGETRTSFEITAIDDGAVEYGEYVDINFTGPWPDHVRIKLGPKWTRVHLADSSNVTPVNVSFGAEIYRAVEGGANAEVTVKLDKAPGRVVRVPLRRHHVSGSVGSDDYRGVPEHVTFGATETEKSFTVTAVNDAALDRYKILEIGFGTLPRAVSQQGRSALVFLDDNRSVPTVTLSLSSASGSISETGNFRPHVSVDSALNLGVMIPLTVELRGGASTEDFTMNPRVRLEQGDTYQGFTIDGIDDADIDPGESFVVSLGELPKGFVLSERRATSVVVKIIDNDGYPGLSIKDAEATEGIDESLDFVVTLSPAAFETVTVDYATSHDTATSPDDYTETQGTLTFEPGETRKTISVPIIDDTVEDDGEMMYVSLTGAAGASIIDRNAAGTIRNTEDPVDEFTVEFSSVPQGHDGSSAFVVRLAFSDDIAQGTKLNVKRALTVTGATWKQGRRVDDRLDLFDITFEPTGDEDVTITLGPSTSDCSANDSVCTSNGTALTGTQTATISGPVESTEEDTETEDSNQSVDELTVDFSSVPESHDGSSAFVVRLAFSDNIAQGTKLNVKRAMTVTGAEWRQGRRVNDRLDLFDITFEPTGDEDVTITLGPSTTDCSADDAVCTSDDTALTGTATVTIAGPGDSTDEVTETEESNPPADAFTVEFVSVPQGHHGWLTFTVRGPIRGRSHLQRSTDGLDSELGTVHIN